MFFQAVAIVVSLYSAPQPLAERPRVHVVATDERPLPPNENPFTTDDTWDCYQVAEPDGTVVERVCETEIVPCHYKHDRSECTLRIVWLPTEVEEVRDADRTHRRW